VRRVTLYVYSTIVIGAGQAGLSAAYHLAKRGVDFLVLDANPEPGGAWQNRWDSLTLGATHHIHPLPDFPLRDQDSSRPASAVVKEYYGEYERRYDLPVRHSATVTSVQRVGEHFEVYADQLYTTRTVINATGTWTNPFWPVYPGHFDGLQVHTNGFISPAQFGSKRVLVVGAGASATQFIVQLREAGIDTLWSTRSAPDWRESAGAEWGLEVERAVNERTRAGLPPKSVVGTTGLLLNDKMRAGIASGALVSRGKIARLESDAVVFTDGSRERIDAILWATGFRHAHRHLRDLKLHTEAGGIVMAEDGVSAEVMPGIFFVGYGASASTLGATRAGRKAALAAARYVNVDH